MVLVKTYRQWLPRPRGIIWARGAPWLLFLVFYVHTRSAAEPLPAIEVGSWISQNVSPTAYEGKCVLVEFWATWCGPCLAVMDHMERVVAGTEDRVFLLSLSNESAYTVRKFMEARGKPRHVAVDYQNRTFERYRVSALPYAMLFSPHGEVLWHGHPSGLDAESLQRLSRQNHRSSIRATGLIKTYEEAIGKPLRAQRTPNLVLDLADCDSEVQQGSIREADYTEIRGRPQYVLAELLQLPRQQIRIDPTLADRCITLRMRHSLDHTVRFFTAVNLLHEFDIAVRSQNELMDAYVFDVADEQRLWSASVHSWSDAQIPAIIREHDYVELDNYTLPELAVELSSLLGVPVLYGGADRRAIYDWSLETSDPTLLLDQLKNDFGLTVDRHEMHVPIYHFSVYAE